MRWISWYLRCKGLLEFKCVCQKLLGFKGSMAEDRKRFFQKLKVAATKNMEEQPSSKPLSLVKSHGVLEQSKHCSKRLRFLRGLGRVHTPEEVPAKATSSCGDDGDAMGSRSVDFSLLSLKEFCTRSCLQQGSTSSTLTVRKRPYYDNRMRSLNKKMKTHVTILG